MAAPESLGRKRPRKADNQRTGGTLIAAAHNIAFFPPPPQAHFEGMLQFYAFYFFRLPLALLTISHGHYVIITEYPWRTLASAGALLLVC